MPANSETTDTILPENESPATGKPPPENSPVTGKSSENDMIVDSHNCMHRSVISEKNVYTSLNDDEFEAIEDGNGVKSRKRSYEGSDLKGSDNSGTKNVNFGVEGDLLENEASKKLKFDFDEENISGLGNSGTGIVNIGEEGTLLENKASKELKFDFEEENGSGLGNSGIGIVNIGDEVSLSVNEALKFNFEEENGSGLGNSGIGIVNIGDEVSLSVNEALKFDFEEEKGCDLGNSGTRIIKIGHEDILLVDEASENEILESLEKVFGEEVNVSELGDPRTELVNLGLESALIVNEPLENEKIESFEKVFGEEVNKGRYNLGAELVNLCDEATLSDNKVLNELKLDFEEENGFDLDTSRTGIVNFGLHGKLLVNEASENAKIESLNTVFGEKVNEGIDLRGRDNSGTEIVNFGNEGTLVVNEASSVKEKIESIKRHLDEDVNESELGNGIEPDLEKCLATVNEVIELEKEKLSANKALKKEKFESLKRKFSGEANGSELGNGSEFDLEKWVFSVNEDLEKEKSVIEQYKLLVYETSKKEKIESLKRGCSKEENRSGLGNRNDSNLKKCVLSVDDAPNNKRIKSLKSVFSTKENGSDLGNATLEKCTLSLNEASKIELLSPRTLIKPRSFSNDSMRKSSRSKKSVHASLNEEDFVKIEDEAELKQKKDHILRPSVVKYGPQGPSLVNEASKRTKNRSLKVVSNDEVNESESDNAAKSNLVKCSHKEPLLPVNEVTLKAKIESLKRVSSGEKIASELGNGSNDGLVDVPIVFYDGKYWKDIMRNYVGSKYDFVNVPVVLSDEKLCEEKRSEVGETGTVVGTGNNGSDSGLIEVPIIVDEKALEMNGLKSNLIEVAVIFDERSWEEIRSDSEGVKEVSGNGKTNKTETKSGSSGVSQQCSSSLEVCCKESKSGIEMFALSPSQIPEENQETDTCSEETISEIESVCSFVGEPVLEEEAQRTWGWRYELKEKKKKQGCWKLNADKDDEIILNVKCHYSQATVNDCIINLGDCALIKGDGRERHVGKILEFFQTTDGEDYFRVQWFYKAEDTVIQKQAASHDKKRLFYSTVMNDNMLDCIISKVSVIEVSPMASSQPMSSSSDFYYDMQYCVEYSTFRNLPRDDSVNSPEIFASGVSEALTPIITPTPLEKMPTYEPFKAELTLLDLYSGCGGMSTGLCLGAKLASVNLVTRWAVDSSQDACDSLKLNHPETLVRTQNAEDFLELLKEWDKLCQQYVLNNSEKALKVEDVKNDTSNVNSPCGVDNSDEEFEVERFVDIFYGAPRKTDKRGLYLKVRWHGYGSSDDTWEPIEGLSNCQGRIEEFVISGHKSKILPLPGDVDVLCGGPPCQGISGYNRHRNIVSPLDDEKNRQIIVFMDIVKFLRPKFVLMENVSDILKFDKASLGRYALSRLIDMKYQARLGTMASGCYGLPQFRLRVFLWGAFPSEKLPQFPLPSHDVVVRYWPATEFERNTVAYEEGKHRDLEKAVILRDAISDLQPVTCQETREEMPYELPPENEFQKFVRLTKDAMIGISGEQSEDAQNSLLNDHRPLPLSEDEYLRVRLVPHKKGANFRDIPGVIVGPDNVAYRDPKNETRLPSGKPLAPNSAFHFEHGKSKRPYARVWWDETVATVVTYPNIKAMACLHPEQDRVFTIRECARLQGFPDYYKFCGSVRERYRQVGNAVSVPVGRALGYCLGMAVKKLGGNEPLMKLPPKFAFQQTPTEEVNLSRK